MAIECRLYFSYNANKIKNTPRYERSNGAPGPLLRVFFNAAKNRPTLLHDVMEAEVNDWYRNQKHLEKV